MVSYGCNLSCVGCTNYADYPHGGFPKWESFQEDLIKWRSVVTIQKFGLIGGEPLLNSRLQLWIYGIREILPDTGLLLVTNGILLDKKPEVVKWMLDVGYSKIMVTLHRNADREFILKTVAEIMANSGRFLKKDRSAGNLINCEYVLVDTKTSFSIQLIETDHFLKRYRGYGARIYPFNTPNIEEAYSRCIDRPLMFDGRLYKCSKMALLRRQLELTGQIYSTQDRKEWEPYLEYKGLSYDDDSETIAEFLGALYKPEPICRSCPGNFDLESDVAHKSNTFSKREWMKQYGGLITLH